MRIRASSLEQDRQLVLAKAQNEDLIMILAAMYSMAPHIQDAVAIVGTHHYCLLHLNNLAYEKVPQGLVALRIPPRLRDSPLSTISNFICATPAARTRIGRMLDKRGANKDNFDPRAWVGLANRRDANHIVATAYDMKVPPEEISRRLDPERYQTS